MMVSEQAFATYGSVNVITETDPYQYVNGADSSLVFSPTYVLKTDVSDHFNLPILTSLSPIRVAGWLGGG